MNNLFVSIDITVTQCPRTPKPQHVIARCSHGDCMTARPKAHKIKIESGESQWDEVWADTDMGKNLEVVTGAATKSPNSLSHKTTDVHVECPICRLQQIARIKIGAEPQHYCCDCGFLITWPARPKAHKVKIESKKDEIKVTPYNKKDRKLGETT